MEDRYVPYLELAKDILRNKKDSSGKRIYSDAEIEKIIDTYPFEKIDEMVGIRDDMFVIKDEIINDLNIPEREKDAISKQLRNNIFGAKKDLFAKKVTPLAIRKGDVHKNLWDNLTRLWLESKMAKQKQMSQALGGGSTPMLNADKVLDIISNCHEKSIHTNTLTLDSQLPLELNDLNYAASYFQKMRPILNRMNVKVRDEDFVYAFSERCKKYVEKHHIKTEEDLANHLANKGFHRDNVKKLTNIANKNLKSNIMAYQNMKEVMKAIPVLVK